MPIKIRSIPKPYQEEAKKTFDKSPGGAIAAHGTGTGKSFTSIITTHGSKGPVVVVVPAALVNNYEKELKKHVGGIPSNTKVMSYEKFTKMDKVAPNTTVVVDEAHRLRNKDSSRYKTFKGNKENINKALLLTASLIYNHPSDMAAPVNLVAGKEVLPEDPKDFSSKYIKEKKVKPGFFDSLRGMKPGITRNIQNEKKLEKALKGLVHYYENPADTPDFPKKDEEVHSVEMSPQQHKHYKHVIGKLPWYLRKKIQQGLPPSKQESKNLNAFLSGTRQVSNTPMSFIKGMSPSEGAHASPKIQTMVNHMMEGMKTNPRHKGIVYSNYLSSGLIPYAAMLKEKGVPHAFFTGKETKKQKDKVMKDYNSGKIPVLLVSSSGAEGLDTKGTREIQITEPHWNEEKIKQIIGRGVRYKSHEDLPKEERKVKVRRYHATPPKTKSLIGRAFNTLLGRKPKKGVDEYLHNMAKDKDNLNQQFWNVIRKAGQNGL